MRRRFALVTFSKLLCQLLVASCLWAQAPRLEPEEAKATKAVLLVLQELRYEQLRFAKIRLEGEWRGMQESLTGFSVQNEVQAATAPIPEGHSPEAWKEYAANSVQAWNQARELERRIAEIKTQMESVKRFLDQVKR